MAKKTINHHVGMRMRLRRTTLGLSQDALGKAVGVASQQIQKYEKGINVINVNRLFQFAQFLRVPTSYFFEDMGYTPVPTSKSKKISKASDRESLEMAKSFKNIKDPALRKRLADLMRMISIKTGET